MNLNQVTVPSTDLSVSIPYYQKLGLKLIVHTHDDYARFECAEGDATFSLHRVDKVLVENGIWVYFERTDLDEYCKILQEKGIEFEHLPKDQIWLWREARLTDPDGNQIIIYKAGNNRKNPPWRKN